MYLTRNKGKSVFAERFIRTFKSKIYKYMTSLSKNVYIADIVYKCNNAYHSTIRISVLLLKIILTVIKNWIKCIKNVFAKGCTPSWSDEILWLKKFKILCRGYTLLVIIKVKKLFKRLTKKNSKKQIKRSLEPKN